MWFYSAQNDVNSQYTTQIIINKKRTAFIENF